MNNILKESIAKASLYKSLLFPNRAQPSIGCNSLIAHDYYTYHVTGKSVKNSHTTRPKLSKNQSIKLNYEQSQFANFIGVTKSWNSWNTSNLVESKRQAETTYDDILIRKFIYGTWHDLIASEIIIKRRFNTIDIGLLISKRKKLAPRQIYFLSGYTEELLSALLKCVVKVELQSVDRKSDTIFRSW